MVRAERTPLSEQVTSCLSAFGAQVKNALRSTRSHLNELEAPRIMNTASTSTSGKVAWVPGALVTMQILFDSSYEYDRTAAG